MSIKEKNDNEIIGRECRFVVYCPPPEGYGDDLHTIKEILHYANGEKKPNVRIVKNFKRDFYVTKPAFQNHTQKKEYEEIENVRKFESTQSDLARNVAKALGTPWAKGEVRRLNRNPFVYGTDILSTAVLKKKYRQQYPELMTHAGVAVFDTETDVVHDTGEIIMATLSYGSRIITVVKKSFVEGQIDIMDRLQKYMDKYLGKFVEERKVKWEVVLVDNEWDCVTKCFERAHEWKPDFVAIWNIDFDISKILDALKRGGLDPAQVFSDPKVPKEFRFFRYKQGPKQKVTASGKMTPIKPSAQWHTVFCPASFYFIDAMCAYRQIRTGSAEDPSYALDAILDKEFKDKPEIRKLKFEEANGYSGLEWHQFMQERHPLEYVIYNVFDCMSMELLDEHTTDLRLTLDLYSEHSDFENFKSQPRRLADKLHYFALENGKVFGSTSDQMTDELDSLTIGLEGWIITLPAHLVADNGLKLVEENPTMPTNARAFVADLDVAGSYPNGGAVMNISKGTTRKELCQIRGVSESVRRMEGINFSGGISNAAEICTQLFGLPNMETLLKAFEAQAA